jgi:hypothetical protein
MLAYADVVFECKHGTGQSSGCSGLYLGIYAPRLLQGLVGPYLQKNVQVPVALLLGEQTGYFCLAGSGTRAHLFANGVYSFQRVDLVPFLLGDRQR